jgi:uncharacterized protein (DUF58 family)
MKEKKKKKPFRLTLGTRSLSFTPVGFRYVIICLAVGIAAVNSGSNLLYLVVSMMLSLMIISGVLSEQALKGLRASHRLPLEIYAGSPFPLRFKIKNTKKRMRSFALAVSEYYQGGGQSPGAFILKLAPGEEGGSEVRHEVPLRGPWVSSGIEVSTRFPFGFFQKAVRIPCVESRIVYPRIRPLGYETMKDLSDRLGERTTGRRGHGAEVRSLREYVSSDEARLIHWKSSARLSVLMAKEFEAEGRMSVTVVFDNLMPDYPGADYRERFEDGVSLTASVIRHVLLELGRPVAFVSRGGSIPAGSGHGHYIALMEMLAVIGPTSDEGREELLGHALEEGPGVFVLVDRRTGWARQAALALLVLEAGG